MSKQTPKAPKVRVANHPMPNDPSLEKTPAARIRDDNAKRAEAKKDEAIQAAANAEELARLAEERKIVKAELEKEALQAIKTMPAVVIKDAVAARQKAALEQIKQWANKTVVDMVEGEPLGIWKSDKAISRLGLDQLPVGAELVHDIVPQPGVSINGVVFAPESRQLLPQHIWDGIFDRTSRRVVSEKNFFYPPREAVQLAGKVFNAQAGPPPMWVR